MKILAISSNIYGTPPAGYGGLEAIVYQVAVGLQAKGHEVAVVSPEKESILPPGIRHIKTVQGEPEENTWKGNTEFQHAVMEEGYDIIWDNSITAEAVLLVQWQGVWHGWSFERLWTEASQTFPVQIVQGQTEFIDLPKDMLRTHSLSHSRLVVNPVSQISRHRTSEVYRIEATRGLSITATGRHAVAIEGSRARGTTRFIPAQETKGQRLVTAKWLRAAAREVVTLPVELAKELVGVAQMRHGGMEPLIPILDRQGPRLMAHHGSWTRWPVPLTDEFLTFLGMWVGDGCYAHNGVHVAIGSHPEHDRVVGSVASQFHARYIWAQRGVTARVFSTTMARTMLSAGFSGDSISKRWPDWVFNLSDRQLGLLLRGYFDADSGFRGDELALVSASKELIDQTWLLLLRLGIEGCRGITNLKGKRFEINGYPAYSRGPHYELTIPRRDYRHFAEAVGFTRELKNERLLRDANDHEYGALGRRLHVRGSLVHDVVPVRGEQWVYDLTVPGYENFIANGICAHNTWQSWVEMGSKGRDPQLPVVHTFHAYPDVWGVVPPWVRHVGAIGLSDDHADHVHQVLGVPVQTAYNGADPEFYAPDALGKRNGRYLWLGRYSPEKGPDVAIQVAKEAKVNLTLVGDTIFPPDKAYIQRCFEAADGLWIKALPAVSRADTVSLYQGHKALLYPIGWREPFSLVLIEAALCGLPVVVMDRGAAREVVQHGVTGFVCKNMDEMREVVRKDLVKDIDPAKCREWGLGFSTTRMVNRYEELFKQFIAQPW